MQKSVSTGSTAPGIKVAPTLVKHDKHVDNFRLQKTTDRVRMQYQQRLRAWHDHAFTIGKFESPQELLQRLSDEQKHATDEALTAAYERARYGVQEHDHGGADE